MHAALGPNFTTCAHQFQNIDRYIRQATVYRIHCLEDLRVKEEDPYVHAAAAAWQLPITWADVG